MKGRYDRQIMLPEIGEEGQERLRKARVLIVGVGGLGSIVALYLTGAGVGTLGLVDADTVSLTNLHRQVLYTEADRDLPKVTCAARRLGALNSHIEIKTYPFRLCQENASEIISRYDLVIDGCDNAATRYLISDTCARYHIPYIYGGITAFGGQVAILCYEKNAPTYRTIFPKREERGEKSCPLPSPSGRDREEPLSPSVGEPEGAVGVIGPTPAVIGSVQANEAIKLICRYGSPLIGQLWTIDLLNMQSHIISL